MKQAVKTSPTHSRRILGLAAGCLYSAGLVSGAFAAPLQITVKDQAGNPVSGFRWLLEEDNTDYVVPGVPSSTSLSVGIHKSHAPVFDSGHTAGSMATVDVPNDQRYFVSVLPDADHTLSGAQVNIGQPSVTVTVNTFPVPTAQISILVLFRVRPLHRIKKPACWSPCTD